VNDATKAKTKKRLPDERDYTIKEKIPACRPVPNPAHVPHAFTEGTQVYAKKFKQVSSSLWNCLYKKACQRQPNKSVEQPPLFRVRKISEIFSVDSLKQAIN
jgi:hypothetical protein